MEENITNQNIKTYTGLLTSLGIFTSLHLIIDVIAFVPFLSNSVLETIFSIVGPFVLLSVLISITAYILSIIAVTRVSNLIRNKILNGYILLTLIVINLILLILTLLKIKGSILTIFGAW